MLVALGLFGAILAGCQSGEPAPSAPIPIVVAKKIVPVDKPSSTDATKIGLVVRKGPAITVGYGSPEKIFDPFRDPKVFVSEFNDLPAKFEYPYRARTWETAHMGLGEILYDGDLVAAMYHQDHVTEDRVAEIVALHTEQMGDVRLGKLITSKRVTYWFWGVGGQRLMICAYQKDPKWIELTVAMGDDVVLDALGISPDQATIDAGKVDNTTSKPILPKLAPAKTGA